MTFNEFSHYKKCIHPTLKLLAFDFEVFITFWQNFGLIRTQLNFEIFCLRDGKRKKSLYRGYLIDSESKTGTWWHSDDGFRGRNPHVRDCRLDVLYLHHLEVSVRDQPLFDIPHNVVPPFRGWNFCVWVNHIFPVSSLHNFALARLAKIFTVASMNEKMMNESIYRNKNAISLKWKVYY
jgi:hypothetical protein